MQYILFSYKLQCTSNHSKAPAYFFSPTMHSQSGGAFKSEVCRTYYSPTMHSTLGGEFKIKVCSAYFLSPTMHSQSGAAFKIEVCRTYYSESMQYILSSYNALTITQKHLHTLLQAVQSNPFKIVKN